MKSSKESIKNCQQTIIESFMSSSIKNLTNNGKILCPICGKKIQSLSRKLRFINWPASIYIFFSHIKCKKIFFEYISEDPSIDNIKRIILKTPMREKSLKMKKMQFFENLDNFLNNI